MPDFDQEKIDTVFKFLQNAFPECSITTTPQVDLWGFNFTLLCDNNLYHLTISESFLLIMIRSKKLNGSESLTFPYCFQENPIIVSLLGQMVKSKMMEIYMSPRNNP